MRISTGISDYTGKSNYEIDGMRGLILAVTLRIFTAIPCMLLSALITYVTLIVLGYVGQNSKEWVNRSPQLPHPPKYIFFHLYFRLKMV